MTSRSKKLLLTSALVAPWLAFATASAQEATAAPGVQVERSSQENVTFVGATDGEVERLIRMFGPGNGPGNAATQEAEDGVPSHLHTVADKIGRLYAEKHYDQIFAALASQPDVRGVRPEVNLLEAWSYHNSGQARKALDLFMTLYQAEPTAAHAAGVIYSGMRSAYYTRTYEFARREGGPLAEILKPGLTLPRGKPANQIEKTRLDFHTGWLDAAIRYRRYETAGKVARLLGPQRARSGQATMMLAQGWQAHKAGDFGAAVDIFKRTARLKINGGQRAEAVFGHGQSLKDAGRLDEANALLAPLRNPGPKTRKLKASLALEYAYQSFGTGAFSDSLAAAQDVKITGHFPRAAQFLEAWSLLKLDRAEEAGEIFIAAYRAVPDQESADGVTAALMQLGRGSDIAALASEVGGPLTVSGDLTEPADSPGTSELWVMSDADAAFYRGDFILASKNMPALEETLTPWLGLTLSYKYRDGDPGLGRLHMTGDKVSYQWTNKTLHANASLEVMHLSSESAPQNAGATGSSTLLGPRQFAPTYDETVFKPSFVFRKEGIWGFEGSLGTTPFEGQVHPTLTGHFDVVHHRGGARYRAGVHRNSIYESILSITGLADTVTGKAYGRVVETGLHGSIYQPALKDWALSAEGRWGERTGENVDTNQTRFFGIGAVYSFDVDGFSYLALGPSFRSTEFDKNRSFFTFGHGGYYSPSDLHNVSLNLNFMTDEGKDWIVRGSASLGYEEATSDAAPYYPLAPLAGDPSYSAVSTDGLALSVQAVGARVLSDALVLEAGFYGLKTESYSEAGAFLKLRAMFGKRGKVYRSDLTEDLYRKYH